MRHLFSLYAAICVLVVLFLASCAHTKYVPLRETHTDTVRVFHQQLDSVWLHDSIFRNQYVRGDTVYQEQTRWHTRYVSRIVRDTVYVSRRDTISVPCPVEKQVPDKLSWHQQARLHLANIVLVALAVLAIVWLFRHRKWWTAIISKILK